MTPEIERLVRENILKLSPYSCARNEFSGKASVWLDANESPYNAPVNRYPDPLQRAIKEKLAKIKGTSPDNIFLGVGSDECIDMCYRVFCRPGVDNVVSITPTYGMYKVCADINDVEYREVMLRDDFTLSPDAIMAAIDDNTKIVWICSPNNPTGNSFDVDSICEIYDRFSGILVVDEAYIDFADAPSFVTLLGKMPRLIVLHTLSKAWGSAGVRLGMAFASEGIIALFNNVKYPYNINALTQKYVLSLLDNCDEVNEWVKSILSERENLIAELQKLDYIKQLYPTDANFILVKTVDATQIYSYLCGQGIVIRNRTNVALCENCLRITVGTPDENRQLIDALASFVPIRQ